MFAVTVPLVFRPDLIIKKVNCCQLEVESVIYTGAGVSVISPGLRDRLQLESHKWEGRFLLLANGHKVYSETCVNLSIMVDNRQIVIQPVVMDINGFDLLLGNDSLRQLQNIRIDYQADEPTMDLGRDDLNVVETPFELKRSVIESRVVFRPIL